MKFQAYIKPVLIIVIVFLAGFFLLNRNSTPGTKGLTPVTLAMDWTPNTDHTGIYVAAAMGWYKKNGINLIILPYSANVSATTLVTAGKADIGIGSMENIVGGAAKHNPVVSIGAVLQHDNSGFIVLKSSGIDRPRDLDGKIYGGYGSPFENAVVSQVLKKDGGDGTFKNVVLNVAAMQALESKRIDFVWGLAGWEVISAQREGFSVNFFQLNKYGIPDSPTLAFVVTPEKIKQQPQLLKAFMAATAKGYEYARQHPRQAAQILITSVPKGTFPDTGLIFASQNILSREYADPGRAWGVQDAPSWVGYPKFMLDSNSITDEFNRPVHSVDYSALYTNAFLPRKLPDNPQL